MEKGLGSPGTPGTPSVLLHGCYYNILLLLQNKYVTKFVLELRAFFVDSDWTGFNAELHFNVKQLILALLSNVRNPTNIQWL